MTNQLDLAVTGIDLSRFVKFTPRADWQWRRWHVLGEPKPQAKGYSRFNGRVGDLLGTVALTHGGGHGFVVQFDNGEIELFGSHALAPARAEVAAHG